MRQAILSIIVLLALGCVGQAQTAGGGLTLEDCIRKALAVPSPVSVAKLDREIAAKGVVQARAGFLPQSTIASGYAYNSPSRQDPSTFSFVAVNGIREYIGLAGIFQEIDTSGRLRAVYAQARAQQQVAGASAGIAERDLKRAVAAAYYRVLLSRHLVDAVRDVLQEGESFERRVRLLSEGGEAARADVVKAATQVAFLKQTLVSAELAATLANQDLAAYWTEEVDTPLVLADPFDTPLPEPEPPPSVDKPYLQRFEFQLLDAQRLGFRAEGRAARAALLPQLRLGFQYGLDVNQVAWNNRGYAATATLEMPIFDWFRARSAARQSELRATQVAETRAISERRLSQEYRASLDRVRRFFEQVALCRSQTELASEDLRLSRLRFEGGEGAAVDVVVAQNQLAQARSNYYASVANYMNARLDLEVAAGR